MPNFSLDVKDRLLLLSLLPAEGDITSLRLIRDLQHALSFSEEEHAKFGIKERAPGEVQWDVASATPKDIEIGPKMLGIIRKTLEDMNSLKKLRLELLPLFERFVPDE